MPDNDDNICSALVAGKKELDARIHEQLSYHEVMEQLDQAQGYDPDRNLSSRDTSYEFRERPV